MESKLHVLVNSLEQFNIAADNNISRLYINTDIAKKLDKNAMIDNYSLYFSMPYIFREKDFDIVSEILNRLPFEGVLIRNIEELAFLQKHFKNKNLNLVLDSSLYILNKESFLLLSDNIDSKEIEYYTSFELNENELYDLRDSIVSSNKNAIQSSVVYGKIPMMISANCINKTMKSCNHKMDTVYIKDRLDKNFQVYCDCNYCYNVVYNTVPLSLHKYIKRLLVQGNIRVDFTDENSLLSGKIIKYFKDCLTSYEDPFYKEYTTGHFKRGVE